MRHPRYYVGYGMAVVDGYGGWTAGARRGPWYEDSGQLESYASGK